MQIDDTEFNTLMEVLAKLLPLKRVSGNNPGLHIRPEYANGLEETLVISDSDLKLKISNLPDVELSSDNLELITENAYERAVRLVDAYGFQTRHCMDYENGFFARTKDEKRGIEYYIRMKPTPDYNLYLMLLIAKESLEKGTDILKNREWNESSFLSLENETKDPRDRDSFDCMLRSSIIHCASIRVEANINNDKESQKELRDLANSYLFTMMERTGDAYGEYGHASGILLTRLSFPNSIDYIDYSTPPASVYPESVIRYYSRALMSDDPAIKFLSFYRSIEYYFELAFRKSISEDFREKAKKLIDDSADDKDWFELANNMYKKIKHQYELGRGNEKVTLEYILTQLDFVKIKEKIDRIRPDCSHYYANNMYWLSNVDEIKDWNNTGITNWNDEEKCSRIIAKRIYQTRNAIVHSKDLSIEKKSYQPYIDDDIIYNELPLMQALSEQVIMKFPEETER